VNCAHRGDGPTYAAQVSSSVVRRCALTDAPLDAAGLIALVADPAAGGLATFLGVVRDHDHGQAVTALTYEAHPDATAVLAELVERIAGREGVRAVAVEHRLGELVVGDVAVVVAVAAEHRAEAFEVCRTLIDDLKAQVPIWKRQQHADGTSSWVGCC